MPSVLISGTNRGIGLALVKRFLEEGWNVHACCRQPDSAAELQALCATNSSQLLVYALDVLSDNSISKLKATISDTPIDLLINNAGIIGDLEHNTLGDINYASWEELFKVNTLAPVKMIEAFIKNIEASQQKHIVSISSVLASITLQEGMIMPYSSSKTALNAVMKSLSLALKEKGVRVNMLSPGWVQTNMGGPDALISPEESAALLYKNINNLGPKDTGQFISHEGDAFPW